MNAGTAPKPQAPPIGLIRPDERDLRDRFYEPALAPLAARLEPDDRLLAAILSPKAPQLPRDQGDEGSCGGHALAALIDIERLRAAVAGAEPPHPVSARMIQTMASRHDASGHGEDEGVSLRDVIKGFYNYGVCPEPVWPYLAGDRDRTITPDRAKAARDVSLGAYYRLRPNLNLYHSALRETGVVLVSAELHPGWSKEELGPERRIRRPGVPGGAGGYFSGGHAFVLVGYDQEGFVVLNSWGPEWGGFRIGETAYPGLAHWTYGDWADSIMDGWALRLGVRAPEAFEFSIGDMGLGLPGGGLVRKSHGAPVRTVLGHYLHLDDGDHVERGAFASDPAGVRETFKLLAADAVDRRRYEGLLLTFAGALLNLADAAGQVAQLKAELWKDRDGEPGRTWYPITALWCVDYVEEARAVLQGVFDGAIAQIGRPGPDLDRLVEERAHGVGRALWRDIRNAAERSARRGGPFVDLLDQATEVASRAPGFGLRIFAEGEGVFALAALVRTLAGDPARAGSVYAMLRSVDVVAPPTPAADFTAMVDGIAAGWRKAGVKARLRLHLPSAEDEARLGVPPYGRSYFDLVERAFLARKTEADATPAKGRRAKNIDPRWSPWLRPRIVRALPIVWRDKAAPTEVGRIPQRDLIYGSDVIGRVRAALADAETD